MNAGKCSISADFLEHQGRKLFCLVLEPANGKAHGSILFLPPFAEEMHRSRHIVAGQARELAAAGYAVMLLDPTGCGDGGGAFGDASWQVWLQDASFAALTLKNRGHGPLIFWGLRLGALLACELAQSHADVQKLILWQPVLNGEQQIDQFLRLRTVASALNNPQTFDRKTLWNELRSGRSLEIAGYELSPPMALEMAKVRLNDINLKCQVNWLEIGNSPKRSLSFASENVVTHWQEQGVTVDTSYVYGEPFWRTVDAEANLDLYRKTLNLLANNE